MQAHKAVCCVHVKWLAKAELKASEFAITRLEAELAQIQTEKSELQKKAMQLSEAA
jgi:hypothetical protein